MVNIEIPESYASLAPWGWMIFALLVILGAVLIRGALRKAEETNKLSRLPFVSGIVVIVLGLGIGISSMFYGLSSYTMNEDTEQLVVRTIEKDKGYIYQSAEPIDGRIVYFFRDSKAEKYHACVFTFPQREEMDEVVITQGPRGSREFRTAIECQTNK